MLILLSKQESHITWKKHPVSVIRDTKLTEYPFQISVHVKHTKNVFETVEIAMFLITEKAKTS